MNRSDKTSPSSSLWLPLFLMACGLALRVVKLRSGGDDWTVNLAPWMALAFTGAIVSPRALPFWVWPLALVATDLAAQGTQALAYLPQIWMVYVCFAVAAIWGASLKGRVGVLGTLGGAIVCSLGFYVLTSTQAWWVSPDYTKSVAGWAQALTLGQPGFPPSLLFLRNSLISDVGFSLVLLLAYNAEAVLRSVQRIPMDPQPVRSCGLVSAWGRFLCTKWSQRGKYRAGFIRRVKESACRGSVSSRPLGALLF
jgi:hypothetical protein